jgi:two-component sensor histidine kinase
MLKRQNPDCKKGAEGSAATANEAESEQKYYIAPQMSEHPIDGNMFKATLYFEDGCEMENIRAYTVIHNLKEFSEEIFSIPENVIENEDAVNTIRERGFTVYVKTGKSSGEMHDFFMGTIFLKDMELVQLENDDEFKQFAGPQPGWTDIEKSPDASSQVQPRSNNDKTREQSETHYSAQSMISVNVAKLDSLMDLMGELVISEAMVTQNPDLKGLALDSFQKAARQLHKITGELQDMVMSIRMVPLSATFQRMRRIVRDMGKKLDKEVELKLVGEETEVDKNIIEHISDPLMHLVRNSIDHGLEATEDREASGKPKSGTVTLEARNSGSDVLIIVKDDGKGLNKTKILERAANNGLLTRPGQEMSDREIYNLVFLPGFSTKDSVSEFKKNTATLASGKTLDFDILIIAVGVRPNVSLIKDAGGEVNRGIITDSYLKTSLENVYAAGDCTESFDITTGENRILALLPNAYMQGECAGVNMAGGSREYTKAIPMNAIGFFGLHMITAGSYAGECIESGSGKDYKKLFVKDGLLKGYIMIGDVGRAGIYTSLIKEKTPLDSVDFELLKIRPQLLAFSSSDRAKKLGGI